jgi:hypothetical protein
MTTDTMELILHYWNALENNPVATMTYRIASNLTDETAREAFIIRILVQAHILSLDETLTPDTQHFVAELIPPGLQLRVAPGFTSHVFDIDFELMDKEG